MTSSTRRLFGAAAATVLALSLAACSDDDGGDTVGSDPAPTTSQPSEPSTSSSDVASETAEPSETASTEAPTGLAAHLLEAGDLPDLGGAWQVEETEPGATDTIGECQQFSFADIGTTESLEREFTAGAAGEGEQVVAEFADPKSAWRAQQVLVSWHKECATQLATDDDGPPEVSDLTVIDGADRFAGHYTVVTGAGAEQETEIVAISQRGTRLSLVVIDLDGVSDTAAATGEAAATAALDKL